MPRSLEQLYAHESGISDRGGGGSQHYHNTAYSQYPVDSRYHSDSTRRANLYDPEFLQYCQACVNKKVHVDETDAQRPRSQQIIQAYHNPHVMADRGEGGCCGRCSACILSIPAGSLSCWILLAIGVSACTGSLYVAAQRTRYWLDKPDTFLEHTETVTMAVLGGMVFIGLIFLMVAALVSSPTNKSVFNTSKKNMCGKVLNIFFLVIIFLFDLVWLVCTLVLTIPVLYFVLFHILYKDIGLESINLKNYAISREDHIIQGSALDTFYSQGKDVFLCYIIALIGAYLVVVSLTCYLMCAAANFVYMKEARYSVLNAYGNNFASSKTSITDTRM